MHQELFLQHFIQDNRVSWHHNSQKQGRRHGFESGEDTQKKFLTPHFLASGGIKYCLDS